jgi:Ca2+-binding RTX toxin-like protein
MNDNLNPSSLSVEKIVMANFTGTNGAEIIPSLLLGPVQAIGDDVVNALGGDDIAIGWSGDDVISGGAGADVIIGGLLNLAGVITLSGIDASDYTTSVDGVTIDLSTLVNLTLPILGINVQLTGASQGFGGDAQGDYLVGIVNLLGSDTGGDNLTGSSAANTLNGQGGADTLDGEGGNDILVGGNGTDTLYGGAGADTIDGGNGIDLAKYNTSDAAVTVDLAAGTGTGGHAQGDVLSNIEWLGGSAFDDTLSGNSGANLINGGGGDDTVAGAGGNDDLYGGNGTDEVDGGDGWDTLQGDAGDDHLSGGAVGDILRGGAGADHLTGGDGEDRASYWSSAVGVSINLETNVNTGGDAQGDTIDSDVEVINGSNHDDVMLGNALTNGLIGFDGADTLSGGGGSDVVRGGSGVDTLNGGAGADFFSYTAISDSTAAATDTIQDFQHGDVISLRLIDADNNIVNGDTAFTFIGTGAFTNVAGQLRYESAGDSTTVSADVNGNGTADLVIHLDDTITLQAVDFLL